MIRRGMAGVVREGRFAGGAIYGYCSVKGEPGQLDIDPGQATIVQRIFREYIDGASCRTIATRLNAEGVQAPRGEF